MFTALYVSKVTLTALDGERAHRRVEREDMKVAFTVENKMASHGVEDRSVREDTQGNVAGVQVVLQYNKSINKKMAEFTVKKS